MLRDRAERQVKHRVPKQPDHADSVGQKKDHPDLLMAFRHGPGDSIACAATLPTYQRGGTIGTTPLLTERRGTIGTTPLSTPRGGTIGTTPLSRPHRGGTIGTTPLSTPRGGTIGTTPDEIISGERGGTIGTTPLAGE